jgi:hypothetical protein
MISRGFEQMFGRQGRVRAFTEIKRSPLLMKLVMS